MKEQKKEFSKWHRELEVFCQIKNSIILEGNIYDSYKYPDGEMEGAWLPLTQYLNTFFEDKGYSEVIQYNYIDGFTSFNNESLNRFAKMTKTKVDGERIYSRFDPTESGAPKLIRDALEQDENPVVIILDLASRYIVAPDRLQNSDVQCYAILQQAILNAAEICDAMEIKKNMLIFITNKQNDLPPWLYLNVNRIKGINIDYPTSAQRKEFVNQDCLRHFFDSQVYEEDIVQYKNREKEWERLIDRFVARTEGFTFFELLQLRQLCINQKIRVSKICSVVDLYAYGIKDNPWEEEDLLRRLKEGEEILTRRVKGQDEAICQSLDVLKRAISGLSRMNNNASPKGVLFFAGPTGTGKTETAKALAELVFGDENSCIRFDMSEYMHSHSDQRLLGAPPGYIGYEAGGQLTNAIRKNPFSILLFDEIEKANPTILDKFLQILDDGRMTDGQGNTVYFSDCIIIFTSNLGIYTKDEYGTRIANVTRDMKPEEVREKIIAAIQNHFKIELGRPEILNRIGENIVVFNYISKDTVREILTSRLNGITQTMSLEKGILIDLNEVTEQLYQLALNNLDNGGRGINNIIEKALINPLARHIFDERVGRGDSRIIIKIIEKASLYDIEWRKA